MANEKIVFKPKLKGKVLSNANSAQARKAVGPFFKPNNLVLWDDIIDRNKAKTKVISAYVDTNYVPHNMLTGKKDTGLEMSLTLGVEMEFCALKDEGCRWYQNIRFFTSYIGNKFKKDMKVSSDYDVSTFTSERGKAVNMKGGMNLYMDASKLSYVPAVFSAVFTAQNGKISFKVIKYP